MKHADFVEKKRHGSSVFPIQYYYIDKTHPHYVMPAHWHKEFEIIRVTEGSFQVYVNNTPYLLSAGSILLVAGGSLHHGEPTENTVYECIVFDLNMLIRQQNDIVHSWIAPLITSSNRIENIHHTKKDTLWQLVSELSQTMKETPPYYELCVYSLLFHIINTLYCNDMIKPAGKTTHTQQQKSMLQLLDWIEKNFADALTLEDLSEVSGFSRKYLCRIFKEYTSKTPIQYINELRIEHACHEMASKEKSITDCAFDNGFNDLSYFCRIFKKYKGITPKEYKKRCLLGVTS